MNNSDLVDQELAAVTNHIPILMLSKFADEEASLIYAQILKKLIQETMNEGSTILQAMIAERSAYYFTKIRMIENKQNENVGDIPVSKEYQFCVREYNANSNILRQLSQKNLPEQQRRVLAQRTISVIEKVVKNPQEKDNILKALIREYTMDITQGDIINVGRLQSSGI